MLATPLPPFPARRPAPLPGAPAGRLRPATSADLPFLARLYASYREPELLFLPWSAAEKQAFLQSQFGLQHSDYVRRFPRAAFWIVCVDEAPVGRLYLDRARAEWRILDIGFLPEHRGKGLGATLIGLAQAGAAAANAALALTVAANNPRARALYRRLGFVEQPGDGMHVPMLWHRQDGCPPNT